MNIKRAKQEIKDAIEAYLLKDEYGEYQIPVIHQRPILLMGPPGIGKTQIMEQIARECKIGLVAYTITHHTRQSAIGLPFIRSKEYSGKEYSVTEYTMSEIIASVYDKIEETGVKEGILFIDEINCVSETLAPTMLQFLQCKMFGNQRVPEGWVIVAAGNPPEYNKSVREFDVVTWDRIKRIDVEENFEVWKEYAYKAGVHPAVISYLDLKKDYFYKMENTVDGKLFATARGWEDLSRLIQAYERLGKKVDREVVHQYIQHWKIAKDFANYMDLYQKYQKDYGLEYILEGQIDSNTVERLRYAAFDERLSVVGMLIGKLGEYFKKVYEKNYLVTILFGCLKDYKEILDEEDALQRVYKNAVTEFETKQKSGQMSKAENHIRQKILGILEGYIQAVKEENLTGEEQFDKVRSLFEKETDELDEMTDQTMNTLDNVFFFLEKVFGESQEMVVFVTELNTNFYSVQFLKENDCGMYYKYNKSLLFNERQQDILKEMEEIEGQIEGNLQ